MRILVTGGAGGIGRATVLRLVKHGHEVRILDRLPEAQLEDAVLCDIRGTEYRQADITNFEALGPHFEGLDAIVHLAALADPFLAPEAELIRINCVGAFNVYRAAADAGIKRVVSASSINALGYNYGIKHFPICYFPVDEAHPTCTTDPYSFSKQILEEIADYFWRREDISGVSLRFPFVFHTNVFWAEQVKEWLANWKQAFEALAALTDAERRARIDPLIAAFDARRSERLAERPPSEDEPDHRPDEAPSSPEEMLMFGRTDFWSIITGVDAAQAIEKGLLADYEGSHPLFVCESENSLGVSSRQLADLYFPGVTTWKRPVEGAESLVSIDRARELIGFEPEFPIRAWAAS
jgi:hypothetical protein